MTSSQFFIPTNGLSYAVSSGTNLPTPPASSQRLHFIRDSPQSTNSRVNGLSHAHDAQDRDGGEQQFYEATHMGDIDYLSSNSPSSAPGPLFIPDSELDIHHSHETCEPRTTHFKRSGQATHAAKTENLRDDNSSLHGTKSLKTIAKCKRKRPEDDPENRSILEWRVQDRMGWSEIAAQLNKRRERDGHAPSYTEAAVYGRFVRNGLRVATKIGLSDFDPKDYLYFKNKLGDRRVGRLHRKNEEDNILTDTVKRICSESIWELVAETMRGKTNEYWGPEECRRRYEMIE